MKKIGPFPRIIFPELATLVDRAPIGNGWLHEIKFDGYRILTFKEGKNIRLMSRNNKEWTSYFENIFNHIKRLSVKKIILDGEVVLLDKNQRPNFQLLQNALGTNDRKDFVYYIFDILYYEKYNLMSLPLIERKSILQKILLSSDDSILRYSDHIVGKGPDVFKKSCALQFEGIISKNIYSPYEERRTKNWLKVKCTQRQEFIIGGFTQPEASRKYFGSLYLGYYHQGKLKYCGNVGTGFNEVSLKKIYELLKKDITPNNPFTTVPPGVRTATWVKPKLIAEIEFREWTNENILRHASFKGLRSDKSVKSITKEKKKTLPKHKR